MRKLFAVLGIALTLFVAGAAGTAAAAPPPMTHDAPGMTHDTPAMTHD